MLVPDQIIKPISSSSVLQVPFIENLRTMSGLEPVKGQLRMQNFGEEEDYWNWDQFGVTLWDIVKRGLETNQQICLTSAFMCHTAGDQGQHSECIQRKFGDLYLLVRCPNHGSGYELQTNTISLPATLRRKKLSFGHIEKVSM